jgi:Ca2+-binding RTX toxin-like protein
MAVLIGNHRPNRLTGTEEEDQIEGRGGNDVLKGLGGDDTILGGDGNDQLSGGGGTNSLDGGAGNDTFFFTDGFDTIIGGDGIDTLSFANATGPIEYDGDLGDIFLNSVPSGSAVGLENIIGSDFDDHLSANGGEEERYDIVHGGQGNDTLFSDQPFASLFGDAGNDALIGGQNGFIDLNGGSGDDVLYGTSDSNMTGGKGNDIFHLNYGDALPSGFVGNGVDIPTLSTDETQFS